MAIIDIYRLPGMSRHSNYDKYPCIAASPSAAKTFTGWTAILEKLKAGTARERTVLCVECYPGTFEQEIESALESGLRPHLIVNTRHLFKEPAEIEKFSNDVLGDDPERHLRTF